MSAGDVEARIARAMKIPHTAACPCGPFHLCECPARERVAAVMAEVDAECAAAQRRGAEGEREGWISYFEAWASAVGASEFTAENVLRAMRGAKPWGCARADRIGGGE